MNSEQKRSTQRNRLPVAKGKKGEVHENSAKYVERDINGVKTPGIHAEEIFLCQKGKSGERPIIRKVIISIQMVCADKRSKSAFQTKALVIHFDNNVVVGHEAVLKGVGVAGKCDDGEKDNRAPVEEGGAIFGSRRRMGVQGSHTYLWNRILPSTTLMIQDFVSLSKSV